MAFAKPALGYDRDEVLRFYISTGQSDGVRPVDLTAF